MRCLPSLWVLGLTVACTSPVQDSGADLPYIDMTVDVPGVPDPGVQFLSPIIEVPPFTEAQVCTFGTYEGPDMGMVRARDYFDWGIIHHTALNAVTDDDYADGEVINCLGNDQGQMAAYGPLFDGAGPELTEDFVPPGPTWDVTYWDADVAAVSMIVLPDGVAFPLRNGQRWEVDAHMLNYYDQPVRTNVGYNVTLVPEKDVQHWAGSGMFDSSPFSLPPGDSSMEFDCAFDHDVTILNIQGHMHDYGSEYVVDVVRNDGSTETVYHIPDWSPDLLTDAPSDYYDPGTLKLQAGEALRTICNWSNPTGEHLPYPAEMCTTTFVAYPLEETMVCFGNVAPS